MQDPVNQNNDGLIDPYTNKSKIKLPKFKSNTSLPDKSEAYDKFEGEIDGFLERVFDKDTLKELENYVKKFNLSEAGQKLFGRGLNEEKSTPEKPIDETHEGLPSVSKESLMDDISAVVDDIINGKFPVSSDAQDIIDKIEAFTKIMMKELARKYWTFYQSLLDAGFSPSESFSVMVAQGSLRDPGTCPKLSEKLGEQYINNFISSVANGHKIFYDMLMECGFKKGEALTIMEINGRHVDMKF